MKKGKFAKLLLGHDPQDLAKAIIVAPSTVYRWFEGALPQKRLLPLIALASNIPVDRLETAWKADRKARRA